MVQKINTKNLLRIPNLILKRVGLNVGDYVELSDDGYKIIITPKNTEEAFTDDEWKKIEKIAKEKKNRKYSSSKSFLKHFDKISKK